MLKFIIGESEVTPAKPIPKTHKFYSDDNIWNNPYIACRKSNRYLKSLDSFKSKLCIKLPVQIQGSQIEKKNDAREWSVDRLKKRQAERELVSYNQLQHKSKQKLTNSKLDQITYSEFITQSFNTRKQRNHQRSQSRSDINEWARVDYLSEKQLRNSITPQILNNELKALNAIVSKAEEIESYQQVRQKKIRKIKEDSMSRLKKRHERIAALERKSGIIKVHDYSGLYRDYTRTAYGYSRSISQSDKIKQLSQPKEINHTTSVLDMSDARGFLSDHPMALLKINNDPLNRNNKVMSGVINQMITKKNKKSEFSILDITAISLKRRNSELRLSNPTQSNTFSFLNLK